MRRLNIYQFFLTRILDLKGKLNIAAIHLQVSNSTASSLRYVEALERRGWSIVWRRVNKWTGTRVRFVPAAVLCRAGFMDDKLYQSTHIRFGSMVVGTKCQFGYWAIFIVYIRLCDVSNCNITLCEFYLWVSVTGKVTSSHIYNLFPFGIYENFGVTFLRNFQDQRILWFSNARNTMLNVRVPGRFLKVHLWPSACS